MMASYNPPSLSSLDLNWNSLGPKVHSTRGLPRLDVTNHHHHDDDDGGIHEDSDSANGNGRADTNHAEIRSGAKLDSLTRALTFDYNSNQSNILATNDNENESDRSILSIDSATEEHHIEEDSVILVNNHSNQIQEDQTNDREDDMDETFESVHEFDVIMDDASKMIGEAETCLDDMRMIQVKNAILMDCLVMLPQQSSVFQKY